VFSTWRSFNPLVVGSIPTRPTILNKNLPATTPTFDRRSPSRCAFDKDGGHAFSFFCAPFGFGQSHPCFHARASVATKKDGEKRTVGTHDVSSSLCVGAGVVFPVPEAATVVEPSPSLVERPVPDSTGGRKFVLTTRKDGFVIALESR
jgi:hypothetical protein